MVQFANAMRRLVFFGAPGVGKGTFAARIAPLLQIPTISTGDILRYEIKHATDLGKQVQQYTDKGALVPDALVTEIIKKRLKEDDAQHGYLLVRKDVSISYTSFVVVAIVYY